MTTKVSRVVDTVKIELDVTAAHKLALILANVMDKSGSGRLDELNDMLSESADVWWTDYDDKIWKSYCTSDPHGGALVIEDRI